MSSVPGPEPITAEPEPPAKNNDDLVPEDDDDDDDNEGAEAEDEPETTKKTSSNIGHPLNRHNLPYTSHGRRTSAGT
jgi:hypothetical protein